MITIARAIEGISINGREYLLDENDDAMLFKDKQAAYTFMREHGGYDGYTDEELEEALDFIGQEETLN